MGEGTAECLSQYLNKKGKNQCYLKVQHWLVSLVWLETVSVI